MLILASSRLRAGLAWNNRMALRQTATQSVPMGQWATPIPHSRPGPLTPDDIAANTFPGADPVFQHRLAIGRRIARVLQSAVVGRDFEIAATFIAPLSAIRSNSSHTSARS